MVYRPCVIQDLDVCRCVTLQMNVNSAAGELSISAKVKLAPPLGVIVQINDGMCIKDGFTSGEAVEAHTTVTIKADAG